MTRSERNAGAQGGLQGAITRLIMIESGQPMTYHMLRGRFDAAQQAAGVNKERSRFET